MKSITILVFILLGLFFVYGFFKASAKDNELVTVILMICIVVLYSSVIVMLLI